MSDYYRPSGFGGFSFFPPVIKNLLIINGIVFIIEMLGKQVGIGDGYTFFNVIMNYFALLPLGHGFYIWQLITYQFLHGGFWHIALNMFALWMFGIEVENMWGSKKFLTFYLMCGVVAGIFQLIFPPLFNEPLGYTIGASGAIFGVLIAFGMMFPNRYIYLWFFVPIKSKYFIAGYVLLELFSIPQGGDIAHLAHLGGALAGFIYIMLDRNSNYSFNKLFKGSSRGGSSSNVFDSFKNSTSGLFNKNKDQNVEDANFYEIKDEEQKRRDNQIGEVNQEEIDKILDKISRSGYQNLSEKEKKILFEASKKMK